jgi:hypothetical protein
MLQDKVNQLLSQQLQDWDLAQKNYHGLSKAQKRTFSLPGGIYIGVQFNAERIYSSSAKVDAKSISERKCFLCIANLPEQQKMLDFGQDYVLLVNPFPIFQKHLTIPHREHIDQRIRGKIQDMLNLARELPDFVVFYNGPACGASAPDHFHFQAGNKGFMPIEEDYKRLSKTILKGLGNCRALAFDDYHRQCIILEGDNLNDLSAWFDQLYILMDGITKKEPEPMMNVLASWGGDKWQLYIFPRILHRPWQFFEEGEKQILLSPASVDLGGMLITPREEDFQNITISDITDIFEQVSWDKENFEHLKTEFANQ